MTNQAIASSVFFATLAVTYCVAIVARLRSKRSIADEDLAGRHLNKWLVGLSAGTTGNSGFIVTAAVGMSYVGGIHWLLMPLGWMLGDLLYWRVFPARLNKLGREAKAATLSEALTFDLNGRTATALSIGVSLLLVIFLSIYTSAQWLAGRKFLTGVFQLSDFSALVTFAATIIVYSSLGGFRGSVYTDVFQAAVRVLGTIIAVASVGWYAIANPVTFTHNLTGAGPGFLAVLPDGRTITALGFVAGFAFAAIGFGLGSPQMVSRYFAGASPEETKSAWWIYIGFTQSTWVSMCVFGILLRGVMPGLTDPEAGLSQFFQRDIGPVITGIIMADVFATIASTSNGLLVAIAQTLRRDVIAKIVASRSQQSDGLFVTLGLGVLTILLSLLSHGTVFSVAIGAISKLGAGLAGPLMIKVFRIRHSAFSLMCAVAVGTTAALVWANLGYSEIFNETGIGLSCSLLTNWVVALVLGIKPTPPVGGIQANEPPAKQFIPQKILHVRDSLPQSDGLSKPRAPSSS